MSELTMSITLKDRKAIFDLIELARSHGLNGHPAVERAKEIIRCRVQECGLGGACNGVGDDRNPCPLRGVRP